MWVCEQTNVIMANLTQTPVTVHKAAYCRCYCDKHNCLQGDFNGTPQACHQAAACLQITSDVGNVAFYVFCSPVWDWLSVPQICSHEFLALYKFVCMYVCKDRQGATLCFLNCTVNTSPQQCRSCHLFKWEMSAVNTSLPLVGSRLMCLLSSATMLLPVREPCNSSYTSYVQYTCHTHMLSCLIYKKFCCHKRTTWRDVSVKILPNAAQQCRNNLYDKFRTNDSNGVRGLQSTCAFSHDKLTVVGVIYKLTVDENCWPHQYSDNFLWRNFLSLKCRNESRDPNHAHLGNSYSSEG